MNFTRILRDGLNVNGLTTAASLLAVKCIGLSNGAGFYFGGIVATIIVYFVLSHSYKLFSNKPIENEEKISEEKIENDTSKTE